MDPAAEGRPDHDGAEPCSISSSAAVLWEWELRDPCRAGALEEWIVEAVIDLESMMLSPSSCLRFELTRLAHGWEPVVRERKRFGVVIRARPLLVYELHVHGVTELECTEDHVELYAHRIWAAHDHLEIKNIRKGIRIVGQDLVVLLAGSRKSDFEQREWRGWSWTRKAPRGAWPAEELARWAETEPARFEEPG